MAKNILDLKLSRLLPLNNSHIKRSYLTKHMGYEGDLGVKRKVLKFSTTLSIVIKFIKAIKMPKNDD